ncbi:MAG: NADP-dependent oxidoreductase, partial [Ilumatobacter sp.]
LKGFLVGAHASLREQFVTEVGGWLADGSLRNDETIVEGIDNAPSAFIGLLAGANTGKMVVAI